MIDPVYKHHAVIWISVLISRIGLRLAGLNNYLDIAYKFKISKTK